MKKTGLIHGNRVDFKDGFVVLPPFPIRHNLGEPDVYAESATPLYPIGTLLWYPGMGKKYRYSRAGAALTGTKFLVANANYVPDGAGHVNEHGFYDGASVVTWDVGDIEVTFNDTINKAANFYEGAYLIHFDAARNIVYEDSYIVSGPPADIVTPWACTVRLYKPLKYEKFALDGLEIWCNPYRNIKLACVGADAYDGYETYMGVPPIPVQNGYYFWLQTAGPVFITPNGWAALCPGFAANSRVVMAGPSGGNITTQAASGAGYQKIGVLLSVTLAGSADALVNMDLDLGH